MTLILRKDTELVQKYQMTKINRNVVKQYKSILRLNIKFTARLQIVVLYLMNILRTNCRQCDYTETLHLIQRFIEELQHATGRPPPPPSRLSIPCIFTFHLFIWIMFKYVMEYGVSDSSLTPSKQFFSHTMAITRYISIR